MIQQPVTERKTQPRAPQNAEEPALFFEEPKPPKKGKGIFIFLILGGIALFFILGRPVVIQGEGTLKAKKFVRVDLAQPGILKEILHKEGDSVAAGEILADLTNPEVSKELQEKKLALEILAHDQKLLEQKRDFFANDLKRKNVLLENGAATRSEVEALELELGQITEQLAIKQKETESLQNEISFLKSREEALHIKAPLRGIIVSDPTLSLGNYLKSGDILFELADPASFYLEFPVLEKTVEKLNTGEQALIRFQAYPAKSFTGTVTSIGTRTQNEVEKVFKVRHIVLCEITLDQMPPTPRFGMHATVRLKPNISARDNAQFQIDNLKEKIFESGKRIKNGLPLPDQNWVEKNEGGKR